jgi:hypothetical protein
LHHEEERAADFDIPVDFPSDYCCSLWNIFSSLTASERALIVELDSVVADFTVDIMPDKEKQ